MLQNYFWQGEGWRLGWKPAATGFVGLVGNEDWAIELTAAELDQFCRGLQQLAAAVTAIAPELMPEEAIACEAEAAGVWLGVEGTAAAYGLRLVLLSGRGAEGAWAAAATGPLLAAAAELERAIAATTSAG